MRYWILVILLAIFTEWQPLDIAGKVALVRIDPVNARAIPSVKTIPRPVEVNG